MIIMNSILLSIDQSNILNLKDVAVKAENEKYDTKKKIKSWRDSCYICCQRIIIGWSTNKYTKKYYYEYFEDYEVNTLHFSFNITCFCYNLFPTFKFYLTL